jgi:hypothetical protein
VGHSETSGATPREARVIDWFRHPTGQPDDPAVIPSEAWLTAQTVVEQTGLYENRRQCIRELNRLHERGVLLRAGNRYRYRPSSWTGVMFT